MRCTICGNEIADYDEKFHRLGLDDGTFAYICPDCMDKIMKWQGKMYSELFPTRTLKRRFGR